ncbi:MAG: threonine aldolase, partial [Deltaproteobacteria bacterium]|nr:threonine aldolase [Deltaproteobacteria bacterium]
KLHIDGARIFNAAAALETTVSDLISDADSISFCLSKGLAAPAGSMVCGSEGFIARARRARKLLGGGMRQTGILAAAGIISLTEMVDRLPEDHANARAFALGLATMDGILIDVDRVKTNLVFFSVRKNDLTASALAEKLDLEGVRVLPIPMDGERIRAVVHYEISAGDIRHALDIFKRVLDRA